VVAAAADVAAGEEPGAALADNDAAGADGLPTIDLHAQVLRIGIAAVAAGALTLLVCHVVSPQTKTVRGTWSPDCFFVPVRSRPAKAAHLSFFSTSFSGSFFGSPRRSRRGPAR